MKRAGRQGLPGSAKRQVLQGTDELFGSPDLGQKLELLDAKTDGEGLRHVDHAAEEHTGVLAAVRLDHEVDVRGNEDAAECGCPVEQLRVRKAVGPILAGGEDIEATEPQPVDDGLVDVVVEVEPDRQG